MFYSPFDFILEAMSVIVPVLVIGMFLYIIISGLTTWHRNNQSPRLRVAAKVVTKRTNVDHHHSGDDLAMSTTSTTYFVTFEVESGDRMEFLVEGREFGLLVEGDIGMLSFQGTRYLGFERSRYADSDEY